MAAFAGEFSSSIIRRGELQLDLETEILSWRGMPLDLTARQNYLLRYFIFYPKKVITRSELIAKVTDLDGNNVWLEDGAPCVVEATISSHVSKLSRRMHSITGLPIIIADRGIGFRLNPTLSS